MSSLTFGQYIQAQSLGAQAALEDKNRMVLRIGIQEGDTSIRDFEEFLAQTEGYLTQIGDQSMIVKEDNSSADPDDSGVDVSGTRELGGIDLNPTMLNLEIERDGNGVILPVSQQPILNINIEGLTPIIINVAPITNLQIMLGLSDTDNEQPTTAEEFPLENQNVVQNEYLDKFKSASKS